VEERIKIYMSNWYQPPCSGESDDERVGFSYDDHRHPSVALMDRRDQVMMAILDTEFNADMPIVLYEKVLEECKKPECHFGQKLLDFVQKYYTSDAVVQDPEYGGSKDLIPIIAYFGKKSLAQLDITYPFFRAFRHSASGEKSVKKSAKPFDCSFSGARPVKNALETVSAEKELSPIIWDVYDLKPKALHVLEADTSWGAKVDKAIWRGKLSGPITGTTFEEKCKSNPRCQLVHQAASLSLVDAGVTQQRADLTLDKSLHLVKSPMTLEEELKYKAIIVEEGDGFATSLPWALYSNSVVIMPRPTKTSFLMEEKLEAWIHYIPCKNDFSDLEKKTNWVMKNGQKAKTIAERGTLWMHDLYMSEEAVADNEVIGRVIVKKYLEFYTNENS